MSLFCNEGPCSFATPTPTIVVDLDNGYCRPMPLVSVQKVMMLGPAAKAKLQNFDYLVLCARHSSYCQSADAFPMNFVALDRSYN